MAARPLTPEVFLLALLTAAPRRPSTISDILRLGGPDEYRPGLVISAPKVKLPGFLSRSGLSVGDPPNCILIGSFPSKSTSSS